MEGRCIVTVSAKPAHNRRSDLTPLYTLLSDGRWWRLFQVTAALGFSRNATRSRLDHAVEEGWVEKGAEGYRLIGAPPPVRSVALTRGLPKGADGRVIPATQTKTVLYLRDLALVRSFGGVRRWWRDMPQRCPTCRGYLILEPPLRDAGAVICTSAGHEVAEVWP